MKMKTKPIHRTALGALAAALVAPGAQGAETDPKAGDAKSAPRHGTPSELHQEKYIFPPLGAFEESLFGGNWSMQTGASVYYRDNNNAENKGVSFGFVQGGYMSEDFHGFSAEGGFLFAPEIWEDQDGDYDDSFDSSAKVRRLFLEYQVPDWEKTYLRAGRVGLAPGAPITHGDAADGATFSVQGDLPVRVTGSAIYRWIHHITSSYDADGISDTLELRDVYDEAGDVFFNVNVEVPVGSGVKITPSVAYQENVLAAYAATGEIAVPLEDSKGGLRWVTKAVGAYHTNEATDAVTEANGFDDEAFSYLVFTGLQSKQGSVGVGYYGLSDDTLDLDPGAFSHFDPLKEDDLYPANPQNDANLFYLKSSYLVGDWKLAANFGFGQNSTPEIDNSSSFEFDFFATYKIDEHLVLDGYFVTVQFEDQEILGSGDYALGGARIRYIF